MRGVEEGAFTPDLKGLGLAVVEDRTTGGATRLMQESMVKWSRAIGSGASTGSEGGGAGRLVSLMAVA